jgi:hypothetical protein
MTNRAMNMVAKKRKVFAKYKDRNHPAVREVNRKTTKALDDARINFEKNWQRISKEIQSHSSPMLGEKISQKRCRGHWWTRVEKT